MKIPNRDRATDPKQYDMEDLSWKRESKADSPRKVFFGEYLSRYTPSWEGKSVLDIGSGIGWLLEEARKAGAKKVLGIEPSKQNLELSRQEYPDLNVEQSSLEDFEPGAEKFDQVSAVMSMSHVKDLDLAFTKVKRFLNEDGELLIVIPDFNYFRKPRKNYKIEVEDISEEEYIVTITRPSGVLVDLVRTNELYVKAAEKAGLELVEELPMTPTEEYLKLSSNLTQDPNFPIAQLLRFKN